MGLIKIKQDISKDSQKEVLEKVSEDLLPIESNIKTGGTQITSFEKDIHLSIGSVANTFPHIRKDINGEFRPKSVDISSKGSFVKNEPVMYTEEVENSRFPCGAASFNVSNKLDVTVGAGGAGISTVGNMKLGSGGRTLISASDEMNMTAGNGNVNVRAGQNISLKSDSMTLETPNQVVVNCNLGVARNAIINGCAFVDGEMYVHHITCPAEVQYTGGGIGSFGQFMAKAGANGENTVIGYVDMSYIKMLYDSIVPFFKLPWKLPDKLAISVLPDSPIPVTQGMSPTAAANPQYSVFVYPHQHPFNNVPITFTDGNESLRNAAAKLNTGELGLASKIEHGYKSIGKTLEGTI